MNYYDISLTNFSGLDKPYYTYVSEQQLSPGQLVVVNFRDRPTVSVVIQPTTKPSFKTKLIDSILPYPPLPTHLLELAKWLEDYYAASSGTVWQTILPAGLEQKLRPAELLPSASPSKVAPVTLNPGQAAAVATVQTGADRTYLLHGITGSGKTAVYLALIRDVLASGRSAIVLVPEIILTPQIFNQFTAQFAGQVVLTHSRLTSAERRRAWTKVHTSSQPLVVVGPRSALFMPLKNLGLIVVDEAHEPSYKQESNPKYHALRATSRLAALTGAKAVFGTATPAIADYFLAKSGRLKLVELPTRIHDALPHAEVIDLRQERPVAGLLSPSLSQAIAETLNRRKQTMLYINRRGSAGTQLCQHCGWVAHCPRCHLTLTLHADLARLICHQCNYHRLPATACPDCQSSELSYLGAGTKRLEDVVKAAFPSAVIARLDKDSTAERGFMAEVYRLLVEQKVDILVGTQMIAKGLDLPGVELVGVVSADTMLHVPDYSASERTFSLITQVAGRAGRADGAQARVLIQSYTPDHPAIQFATTYDFAGFYQYELAERQKFGYPPAVFLLKLILKLSGPGKALAKAEQLKQTLAATWGSKISLAGPAPANPPHDRGRECVQLIVKAKNRPPLVEIVRKLPVGWSADLDPLDLL